MIRLKLSFLLLISSLLSQVFAADSTRAFVLSTFDKIKNNDWGELVYTYHPDDIKKVGSYLLIAIESETDVRRQLYGNEIYFEDIKNKDNYSVCAKYLENYFASFHQKGTIIDSVRYLGQLPDSDSISMCMVSIEGTVDTQKFSYKYSLAVQDFNGVPKIRFDKEILTSLARFDNYKFNDSRGCNFKDFNPENSFLMIGAPDQLDEYPNAENTEIMVFDLKSKEEIRLTKDLCGDSYPAWYPDGKKIFFTSRRPSKDESGPKRVFYLDLKTKRIRPYDVLNSSLNCKSFNGCENLCWSINKQLLFTIRNIFSKDDIKNMLHVFDEVSGNLSLVDSTSEDIVNTKWSDNGRYIYYRLCKPYDDKDTNKKDIHIIYDIKKKEKLILPNSLEDYFIVGWMHGKQSLLFQRLDDQIKTNTLVTYSLENGKVEAFETVTDARGSFIDIGRTNQILYLQRWSENIRSADLWSYDLAKREFTKLLPGGGDELMYYRFINQKKD